MLDDKGFFSPFRMPRQSSVGKALPTWFVYQVHDSEGCSDREEAQSQAEHDEGVMGGVFG